MLANGLKNYIPEIKADFRQYYQLDLAKSLIEGELALDDCADLLAQLPSDARFFVAINPANLWTTKDYILADIANNLRMYIYGHSDDAQKGINKPDLILPPGEKQPAKKKLTKNEIKEILSKPRKAVK